MRPFHLDNTLRYIRCSGKGLIFVHGLLPCSGETLIDLRRKGKCLFADNEYTVSSLYTNGEILSHFTSLYTGINMSKKKHFYELVVCALI